MTGKSSWLGKSPKPEYQKIINILTAGLLRSFPTQLIRDFCGNKFLILYASQNEKRFSL